MTVARGASTERARSTTGRAIALVIVASCLFGTTGTALGRVEPDAAANGVSAVRLVIGALTLVAIAAAGGARPRALRGHGPLLALGAAAVAGYQLCFFVGTTRTGVALATVVTIGSGPVLSGAIDAIVFRRRPPRAWVFGTA